MKHTSLSDKLFSIKSALLLMGLFFILLALRDLFSTHLRTVVTVYHNAAMHWLHNENLYDFSGGGFLYLPQAAILNIPFTYIHSSVFSNIAWRGMWMAFIAYTLFVVCNTASHNKRNEKLFFTVLIVTLAIGESAIKNGQLNMAILVMSFLSMVAIYRQQWWLAASLLATAVAVKTLLLVLLCLCFALYPKLRIKLIFTFFIMLLIPFIGKNPHYVIAQYQSAWQYYHFLMTRNNNHPGDWAQLFSLLSDFGVTVPPLFETAARVIFGLLTLLFCLVVDRAKDVQQGAKIILIYMAATTYLLLFEPITESNTYIIFAPIVGFFWYQCIAEKSLIKSIVMGGLVLIYLCEYPLKKLLIPGSYLGSWISPLLTILIVTFIISQFFSKKRKQLFNFIEHHHA